MGTTADKLNCLINTKEGIRQEINRAYNAEEVSTSDTFNSYIQKLEEHPFYLKRLVEGTIESIKLSNATSIGTHAFYKCSNLTEVSFPNATSIGGHAFHSCSNLTEASFPNATSIGSWVFNSCSSLTNVSFPNATSIGEYAFSYCNNLTSASFPNATSIGMSAFSYCKNLTDVSFPNATSIGSYAFEYCSSLTTIYVGTNISTVCTLGYSAFDNCTNLTNICVPYSLVDSYKSATNWSNYADKIKADAEPVECITLSITADDVIGNATSTTVYYTAECTYTKAGVPQTGTKVFTGKGISESFAQNTSTTNTVQRTVSFTFLGKTATTTITQGVWIHGIFVTTEGISDYGWVTADSKYNVDGYDVYMSNNEGVNSSNAVMKLECMGYTDLTLYIRSYAEKYSDYTIASNANASTYPTRYDSSDTKAHTRVNQQSGTALSNYTAVNYTGLKGIDIIYIVFTKDSIDESGDDRGYVLIPKQS